MPYDHTSLLAMLRDWLKIPESKMLTSARVKDAPTLSNVPTRGTPRTDLPAISLSAAAAKPKTQFLAYNDLQSAILNAQRQRYKQGFRNLAKMKRFGTPPETSRGR